MDNSPSKKVWLKFKRNKFAFGGLVFILLLMVMGILGYLIMPDDSPNANVQILQLNKKKPGSTFTFLIISRSPKVEKLNFFERMLNGQTPTFKSIPITSYKIKGKNVFVQEYIGDDEKAKETKYELKDLCPSCVVLSKIGSPQALFEKNNIYKKTYILGTDIYGRDLLSRLILGIRVSLSVGLMAVLISLFIGVSLGAIAGYFGGRVDAAISWFMNVVWSLPSLLLVIAISFALGKGFWQIFIAVGLSTWVDVARLVRGQVMALKEVEFVEAARALGFSTSRTIIKHILPNIAGPILVVASSNFASAILLETGLSFLGFGAQPPMPSWGSMIKEHYGYIIMDAAYLAVLPGLAIMFTVYAFNVLAIGLRDAFDVKGQNVTV
ncbi:Oligopeptide transport system permease protein OppC [Pedobacter sp. Bi27]|uniref:ABC transporter permease n=1 Tax=unclassified Pedobacter TaxID=2628915 RepID=UPI001DFF2446|nr:MULTISPECIES: ABC transporter permease [unclassified Pedobacter]CAH0223521.1 Oligopeptide transport system permease protein OppC [Pedobacter sp. Bi27]CAH0236710.1 Oligopeptide transport system permease protein OppC [Pedobacter sp. Bi36]CAH0263192.1 Oligopeptide transport system permease protein OppC [Pedobacter sp. Bi126]